MDERLHYQIRDYKVKDGELETFLNEWKTSVVPLRKKHGFAVVGAWIDRKNNRFTWVLSHEGDASDFEAAERAYYESPERKSLRPDPARHLSKADHWLAEGTTYN